ncbi:RNA polymerase sigma factor [Maribacter sp. 2304DJ31-5]|uniref:RNA polymerase sigma factor n=1 Tax=Maribacter sp. 2304DJ31-5 TaxID=3386273 RepID=UPI0039BCD26B
MKKVLFNKKNLVKQLRKGDTDAYAALVELYYEKLCHYATSLARDNFKSEDIVQNVIVRLWQQREKLNPDVSVKNYLYKSVYNEFINQYRKDVAITKLEKKYVEGMAVFHESLDDDKTKKLIHIMKKEIKELPPKCRETFILSKEEGLTYTEIAAYQNVSVNTVENQMVKAFSILRKKIKEKLSFFYLNFIAFFKH